MDIAREFYNAVCDLKYRGVKIFNYLQTSIDTLTFYIDYPERIDEVSLFKGTFSGIPVYVDTESKASKEIQKFLDSLEKRDVLFFTSAQFRKEANGKLYHTVLDPYILSLPVGKYSVIECGNSDNAMFYEDVHTWNYDTVRFAYGVDAIDYNDLFAFMKREFFPQVRNILGLNLSAQVEHGITTFLFYRLCFRKAEYNFALDILRKVNPAAIFYSHGCNPCFMYLAEAAYALGIPAIEIAHGFYAPLPERPTGINDFYIMQNQFSIECSVLNGYYNMFRVGKPGFGRTEARRLANGPIVVLFVSSCEYGLLELAAELSNILDPQKYTVAFRFHPGERYTGEYLTELQAKYKHIILTGSADPIEAALDQCDIVVGNRSTVLMEALRYKNVKVITCNLAEDPMPPKDKEAYIWERIIATGELKWISTLQELEQEIVSYKRDEFIRDTEVFWDYNGDIVFPAFIELCTNKKAMMRLSAVEESLESIMAIYDVDSVPRINDIVSSENGISMEYVGIESSDDEDELMEYIKNSPCKYITVIRPDMTIKEDAARCALNKLALFSNNPYLDVTLTMAGKFGDVAKDLGAENADRYRNIVRVGIYPFNNIMDLCMEERAVSRDLSECVYRKDVFVRICSCVGVHNFIKQSSEGLTELLGRCRSLSLKAAYAEEDI